MTGTERRQTIWSTTRRRLGDLRRDVRERLLRRALNLPSLAPFSHPAPPVIMRSGDFTSSPLGIALANAFDKALTGVGGPTENVRRIPGMSGQKYRTFINALINSLPDARYLEVGSWAGSTAASAIEGNRLRAVCIDNWSQFGGPKDEFIANLESVLGPDVDFTFIESDFRKVDFSRVGHFNVYLFDGPHNEPDQYDGIIMALPALDDYFVLIVDDWNWVAPRIGTFRAIRDAGVDLVCSVEIRITTDNSHSPVGGETTDWHNGYFFAVLKRRG